MTTPTCDWVGTSGTKFPHYIYPLDNFSFKAEPGNYIFAKKTSSGWVAIYVGQTKNLSERFDDHHAMPCAQCNGAKHIHAHVNSKGEKARLAEESDLIANYKPGCNKT